MNRRDYLKYLGFKTAFLTQSLNDLKTSPPMTLPQETIDRINNEAEKYGFVVPYDGSNKFYNEDKVKGYQAGATEWVGKAKPVVDVSEEIIMLFDPTREHVLIPVDMILRLSTEIAKYKEMANG